MAEKEQTVEQVTKLFEQKIAEREEEIKKEKEQMKEEFEKEKKRLEEEKNKAISDIILGRQQANEVQENDEENDKSFFDKQLEETKKILGITKGGKK